MDPNDQNQAGLPEDPEQLEQQEPDNHGQPLDTGAPEDDGPRYLDGSPVQYDADGNALGDYDDPEYLADPQGFVAAHPELFYTDPVPTQQPEIETTPESEVAPEVAPAPVVAKPAKPKFVAPSMPNVSVLPPMTDAERAELSELLVTDPLEAQTRITQRAIREEHANSALIDYHTDVVNRAYPRFSKEYGNQVKQALREFPATTKADPNAYNYAIVGVLMREAVQKGISLQDAMENALSLMKDDEPAPMAPAAKPVAAKPVAKPAPRTPSLAPSQRTQSVGVGGGAVKPQASNAPGRIPAAVKGMMDSLGISRQEAELALSHKRPSRY